MFVTRRSFVLFSLCAAAQQALPQGIASRDVKAQAAPPPSGKPYNAHFEDVAEVAGFHVPVILSAIWFQDCSKPRRLSASAQASRARP